MTFIGLLELLAGALAFALAYAFGFRWMRARRRAQARADEFLRMTAHRHAMLGESSEKSEKVGRIVLPGATAARFLPRSNGNGHGNGHGTEGLRKG